MQNELNNGNEGQDGIGDARRHAYGMKNVAAQEGPMIALVAGTGHELTAIIDGSQTLDRFLSDMHNNLLGIAADIFNQQVLDQDLSIITTPDSSRYNQKN